MLDPKGIDFVIPLGRGSQFKNCELRYCLRSLERYAKGIRRVVVVGHDPGFLSEHVVHLECPDFQCNKEARIAIKVLWAWENYPLTDEILFGNDDFTFFKPFDAREVKPYQRGTLLEEATRVRDPVPPGLKWKPDPHQLLLQATHDALVEENLPALSYELHCPIRYERRAYFALRNWWERSMKAQHGLGVKSVYGNAVCNSAPGPFLSDLKFARYFGERHANKKLAEHPERWCFSYGDQALYEDFETYLYKHLPEKSRFEI